MVKSLIILGVILAVSLIGTNASSLPTKAFENARVKFVTSEELKELLKQNPNLVELNRKVKLVTPETKETAAPAPRYTLEYYLGARTPYDFLVAHDAQSHSWSQARDVEMTLEYPSQGRGRIVTFVDIFVNQSTLFGRAYVIYGGIGYRYITIVVEADNTYYFDHDASIFGQD